MKADVDSSGDVLIESARCLRWRPGFQVWFIDCRTKYSDIAGTSLSSNWELRPRIDVLLHAPERALHTNPESTGAFSVVTLRPGPGRWRAAESRDRYSHTVVLYTTPGTWWWVRRDLQQRVRYVLKKRKR